MNDVTQLLQSHRSIRKFRDTPVTEAQVEAIVRSAQAASSSSNVQAYTIIRVTDAAKRQALAQFAGNQAYVAHSGLLLVFCADLHKLAAASELHGEPFHQTTESFLIASVDAALAAQNAAVAAESLGLGVCFIGGIRNAPAEVSETLALPPLVYPIFGLTIGVPDQEPSVRPRLPLEAVLHENRYDAEAVSEGIRAYDETTAAYYKHRTGGGKSATWSQQMAEKNRQPLRPHLKPFLEAQGFKLV